MENTTPLKLLQKLHSIMAAIDNIEKDKYNDFYKYAYASEEAIKRAIHKQLVEHKVLFRLGATNLRRAGTITDVDCTYTFIDVDSGESLSDTFVGTGEDKLDKGTYKAITGAIKYILTSTFMIPTGDDPENDEKKPVAKTTKTVATTNSGVLPAKLCNQCKKSFKPRASYESICIDCYKKNKQTNPNTLTEDAKYFS